MKVENLITILKECNHKLINNNIRKVIIVDSEIKYAIQIYFKGATNTAPLTIFKEKSELNDSDSTTINNNS